MRSAAPLADLVRSDRMARRIGRAQRPDGSLVLGGLPFECGALLPCVGAREARLVGVALVRAPLRILVMRGEAGAALQAGGVLAVLIRRDCGDEGRDQRA